MILIPDRHLEPLFTFPHFDHDHDFCVAAHVYLPSWRSGDHHLRVTFSRPISRDRVIGSVPYFVAGISSSSPMVVGRQLSDPPTSCEIGFSEKQFSLRRDFRTHQSCDGCCYSSHVSMSPETRRVVSPRMLQETWVSRLAIWRRCTRNRMMPAIGPEIRRKATTERMVRSLVASFSFSPSTC